MSFWKAFKKPNGVHDLDPLKEQFSKSARRVQDAARNLARAAESVSQQKKDDDFQKLLHRFRVSEGHD